MNRQSNQAANQTSSNEKQVSLGPACLVVFIIAALLFSVTMIVAAWMIMGNQGPMAARAIESQMIPWVEQSSLEPTDRDSIVRELRDLVEDLKADRLDERQMFRLKARIADSPVLQWGAIQQLQAKIQASGLTQQEKEDADLQLDRFLRCAGEGKMAMEQMEFVVQKVVTKERSSGRLTALSSTDDQALREFLRRAKALCDNAKIPEEPFPKSPAQVFHALVEDGLAGKEAK